MHSRLFAIALLVCLMPVASAQKATSPATNVATAAATNQNDYCPTRDVLAKSEFSINCHTTTQDFLVRLREACTDPKKLKRDQGCAALIYTIDPDVPFETRKELNLQLTWTVKIAKVAIPEGDLAKMSITLIQSNGSSEQLTLEGIDRLLAPIRVGDRVRTLNEGNELVSDPGAQHKADQHRSMTQEAIRYYPALFVSRADAPRAMTPEAIRRHFDLPIQILQDKEQMLSPDCLIYKRRC